eukprot:3303797-Pleurochrysis_carterae.AAC.2
MRQTTKRAARDKAKLERRYRLFKTLLGIIQIRPKSDAPHAINMLVHKMSAAQRADFRLPTSVRRERFVAQKELCRTLRTNSFNAKASLTVRLENFMLTRAIDRANTVLSKTQQADGTWRRPAIIDVPTGCRKTNRKLGIHRPVRNLNIFSSPKDTALEVDSYITPFGELGISGHDFNTVFWRITTMASSDIGAATAFDNLRQLDASNPFLQQQKVQLQFDGTSWTRGHGCTRLIVRTPDLVNEINSPLYSRDVMFYIGGDKLLDLQANFRVGDESSIHSELMKAMTFVPSSDPRTPPPFRYRCHSRMHLPALKGSTGDEICGPCDVAVAAGGDMAAAHFGWSLDSPVARYGCCFYC